MLSYLKKKKNCYVPPVLSQCAVLSRSGVSDCDPMDCMQPAWYLCQPGFSRQEYWNELPCPPPGDLPSPGIK